MPDQTQFSPAAGSTTAAWQVEDIDLVLDVTGRANMTLWAAAGPEEEYAIKVWGPGAERIYGYSRAEALGRNYIDLFVNPSERAKAIEDHDRIVATGEIYTWDWAADDITADGDINTMLTHCFRVRDPSTGQWLLAELGIDISHFNRASQQLRNVREEYLRSQGLNFAKAIGNIGQAVAELGDHGTLASVTDAIFSAVTQSIDGVAQTRIWLEGGEEAAEFSSGNATSSRLPFTTPSAVEYVMERGEAVFFDAATMGGAGHRFRVHQRRSRSSSFALFPLRGNRTAHPMGVLAVAWKYQPAIAQDDRDLLETLAVFAGHLLSVGRDFQRSRVGGRKRQLAETKESVFRSVLHTVGNEVFLLQGLEANLRKAADEHGVPPAVLDHLDRVKAQMAQLDTSLKDLRKNINVDDQAEVVLLRDSVGAVINTLRVRHPSVQFDIDVPADLTVFVVHGWLDHILSNVINNAVQILLDTDGGGVIAIDALLRSDKNIEVNVEDSGPGVDPAIRKSLFDDGVSLRLGGTGQGLYIARDLAISSGGSIDVVDEGPRLGGAHFRLTLPVHSS